MLNLKPYLRFCDSVPGELHHGKVAPANGFLDLIEADFEWGAPSAVAGRLVHVALDVLVGVKAHHHSY